MGFNLEETNNTHVGGVHIRPGLIVFAHFIEMFLRIQETEPTVEAIERNMECLRQHDPDLPPNCIAEAAVQYIQFQKYTDVFGTPERDYPDAQEDAENEPSQTLMYGRSGG